MPKPAIYETLGPWPNSIPYGAIYPRDPPYRPEDPYKHIDMPTIRKAGLPLGKKLPDPHSKHVKIETLIDRETIEKEIDAGRYPKKPHPSVYFEPDPEFRKIANMRVTPCTTHCLDVLIS